MSEFTTNILNNLPKDKMHKGDFIYVHLFDKN